ncbi:hypothetical protein Q3G72_004331 [Acer saccharum]|nr:hypothetical protein Q3G72_004331 [Acer saccharum]
MEIKCEGRRQAFQKIKKSPTKAVGQLEIDRRLRKVVKGINLEKKADKEGFVTAADKGKGIRIRISKTKQKRTSFYNAKLVIDEKCDDRFRMDSDDESSSSLMESESRGGYFSNSHLLRGESSKRRETDRPTLFHKTIWI